MARTITEIQDEILKTVQTDENLSSLNSTSKTAIYRLWSYIVATSQYLLETLWDKFKAEVESIIELSRPHTSQWYQNKALSFQIGYELNDKDYYDTIDTEAQIIDQASIEEGTGEIFIKIATNGTDGLEPLQKDAEAAFKTYMNRVKDAGTHILVRNTIADDLKLTIRVWVDPLVIDSNGCAFGGDKVIEEAIDNYLTGLEFNGQFSKIALLKALLSIPGINDVAIDEAKGKHIVTDGVADWSTIDPIDRTYTPYSGYIKIENYNGITYVSD